MNKQKLIYGLLGASVLGGSVLLLSSNPNTSQSSSTTTDSSCKYSCTGSDKDCSDFSTHKEAQDFFNCCGFTATKDSMKLDSVGVGDGVACEAIP